MNSIALSGSANDSPPVTALPIAATSGDNPLASIFKVLLEAAEPLVSGETAAPVEAPEETHKATPLHDTALPLDEIAEPAKETGKEEDNSAALAYAFIASMPITPQPELPVAKNEMVAKSEAETKSEAPAVVGATPAVTPHPLVTPAPKPEHAASAPEQSQHIDIMPVDGVPEPRGVETAQGTLPYVTKSQDGAAQRVILEARITKQTPAAEPGKSAVRKDTAASVVPEPESNRPVTSPVKEVSKTQFTPPEHKDEQPAPLQEKQPMQARQEHAAPAFAAPQADRLAPPQTSSHEPVREVVNVPDIPEPPPADQTPLKRMDLRIPDANGGGVTVRLQERAGAFHVSVHSNDTKLANGVAENLPELTRNLDRQGYRAETRIPSGAEAAPESLLRTGSTRDHAVEAVRTHSEAAPQLHTEQAQSGSETNDGHRKPDWQEEMYKRPKRQSNENFKEYLS